MYVLNQNMKSTKFSLLKFSIFATYKNLLILRPSQGFWGFREKGYLFSGIWGEGSFIFRDLGVLGSREQEAEEKHFRDLGRKVIFLSGSREQRPFLGGLNIAYYINILGGETTSGGETTRGKRLGGETTRGAKWFGGEPSRIRIITVKI